MLSRAIDGVLSKGWPASGEWVTITVQPQPTTSGCNCTGDGCWCLGFSLFEKSSGKLVQSDLASGMVSTHNGDKTGIGAYAATYETQKGYMYVAITYKGPASDITVDVAFKAALPSRNYAAYKSTGSTCDLSSIIRDQSPSGGYQGLVLRRLPVSQ